MIKYLSEASPSKLKRVALLRLDFNTEDDWRMKAVLPTIKFLLRHASKIVILSHRGRPGGIKKVYSLEKDAKVLERMLGRKVNFIPHFNFPGIKQTVDSAPERSVFLLENLRFMRGERENSRSFAKEISSLADYYVNDAFAVSHRANASIVAITGFLPSYAGLELEKEIKSLSHILKKPRKPLVFILGGSKAQDKLGVMEYFRRKVDWFLLGGAPANTLFLLNGLDVKKSLADRDPVDLRKMRKLLNYKNVVLPPDFVFHNNAILDIGTRAVEVFAEKISRARTVIWSGPLGLIEKKPYDRGTLAVARAISKNKKAFSLAGGGETVMFLKKHGLDKKFSFISTGGGAMLEFLAGKKLPGIKTLEGQRSF